MSVKYQAECVSSRRRCSFRLALLLAILDDSRELVDELRFLAHASLNVRMRYTSLTCFNGLT